MHVCIYVSRYDLRLCPHTRAHTHEHTSNMICVSSMFLAPIMFGRARTYPIHSHSHSHSRHYAKLRVIKHFFTTVLEQILSGSQGQGHGIRWQLKDVALSTLNLCFLPMECCRTGSSWAHFHLPKDFIALLGPSETCQEPLN